MKIIIRISILLFGFLPLTIIAQNTITGYFPGLAGQQVRLIGFEGFGIYTIDSTTVSEKGEFLIKYTSREKGMGYLAGKDNKACFVVLAGEDIALKGHVFNEPESIVILAGKQNQQFARYATEHPKRERALSAWDYLIRIYQSDSLFLKQSEPLKAIETEIQRIKKEDIDFLKNLDPKSYVSWYLPVRKLVSSVSSVAQYRTEEIPATLAGFRTMDYTDNRLYKSGLLKDAIESHYWLLENMGQPLDTVFMEMNISTDFLFASLSGDEEKLNEITKFLFDLLERHSLFQASEYLAIKALTQNSCTLTDDLAKQLETYRVMKKGNTAPDILFAADIFKNGTLLNNYKCLSEIETDYTLLIFGASWCPKCVEELSQIPKIYSKWKSKELEVVFVSLDTDTILCKSFTKFFPFITMCDYKKWETQSAKDYYVFSTPTMFLLDGNRKILLRPISVKQVDAYVDYNIRQEIK